eukprot:10698226-Alexandrium_andersonii.AAC.1
MPGCRTSSRSAIIPLHADRPNTFLLMHTVPSSESAGDGAKRPIAAAPERHHPPAARRAYDHLT